MTAHDVLVHAYTSLVDALADTEDEAAWNRTRCPGWAVQDLVHHLLSDAQRALVALHTPSEDLVDTDEITYWEPFTPGAAGDTVGLRNTRVVASVWTFAPLKVAHREAAHAVLRASAEHRGSEVVTTQGRVLTVGSLCSTLAVEATVHQLDLRLGTPSAAGLTEVRNVLDGLLGHPAPIPDDVRYALIGTGREPVSPSERQLLGDAASLPLFG
jgi:hypothetical protein